ncbi:LacI family DNA-binding transcriptional regulator [Tetragenococcus halophilus]|uniref:LacI family DNA-binding transcriptional regulator n=1 Tax=Tetragenococcus halophilus TaxID=51669 RepID=UPI0012FE368D|nr:LacI family DNA-binding transcriptional regulator [Tetragenococcus halophilus]
MKKSTTLKDIAEKAGVSVATVSYVLNYSEKQKISNDTRLKIFEIAKELNYVPNLQAKYLASAKTNKQNQLAGIIFKKTTLNCLASQYVFSLFLNKLQLNMQRLGVEIIPVMVDDFYEEIDKIKTKLLDFMIVVNFEEESIERFTEQFLIPIVFLGSPIDSFLFKTISIDYQKTFQSFKLDANMHNPVILLQENTSRYVKQIAEQNFDKEVILINSNIDDVLAILKQRSPTAILSLNEVQSLQIERELRPAKNILFSVIRNEVSLLSNDTKKILIDDDDISAAIHLCLESFITWDDHKIKSNQLIIQPHLI